MCETQRQIIKSFTQESLDQCTEIMKDNFEKIKKDMLDKLVDGVRLDIFDKINGPAENNTDYKIYSFEDIKKELIEKFPIIFSVDHGSHNDVFKKYMDTLCFQVTEKLRESRILKKNEYYIHFINHYHWVFTIPPQQCNASHRNIDVVMILCTVTNFSNLTWLEIRCKLYEHCQYQSQNKTSIECKNYDLNTPLHSSYINILSTIKSLSPQSLCGSDKSSGGHHNLTVTHMRCENVHNVHGLRFMDGFRRRMYGHSYGDWSIDDGYFNNDNCVIFYTELYDIIVKILDMNKKYSMNMLVELDLQKKYEKLLNDKDTVDATNKLLEEKIKKLEDQLKDSIPVEHQCCICFGFTDKKTICVPCGHAQYCSQCIKKLSKCAICRETVTSVVKTYS